MEVKAPKLRGALGAIERRVLRTASMNEFGEPARVRLRSTKRIVPNPSWDGVVREDPKDSCCYGHIQMSRATMMRLTRCRKRTLCVRSARSCTRT